MKYKNRKKSSVFPVRMPWGQPKIKNLVLREIHQLFKN